MEPFEDEDAEAVGVGRGASSLDLGVAAGRGAAAVGAGRGATVVGTDRGATAVGAGRGAASLGLGLGMASPGLDLGGGSQAQRNGDRRGRGDAGRGRGSQRRGQGGCGRKRAASEAPYKPPRTTDEVCTDDVDEVEVIEEPTGPIDGNVMDLNVSEEEDEAILVAHDRVDMTRKFGAVITAIGMYYSGTYLNKSKRRHSFLSDEDWVRRTLHVPTDCYDMFRMSRPLFDSLHDLLVSSYLLETSSKMSSEEALGMFLWIIGAPQSFVQVKNRFQRSKETISRKFDDVLHCVFLLAKDLVKPRDPNFTTIHPRLLGDRFEPHFNNCIGAIDGTHIPVVVPSNKLVQHVGRHGYPTQNVLAICDFDMRFTFVVAGWPRSAHDMRVFNDALRKYGDIFPHPPQGKFYLVDSGYPNRSGYLAPYKGTKYHLPEFRAGPRPSGKKEVFNHLHSSLRNVIERSFGVLKMKWRILLDLPSYPMLKQSKIIHACMALHNFIRDSTLPDIEFDRCDQDENYMPMATSQRIASQLGDEEGGMNVFRDSIANALFARRE